MLVIAGRIRIDPANRERAVEAARDMMDETQKEAGCITYAFTADLFDPGCFRVFEEWESPEALEGHFATPHMARFQAAAAGLGVVEMTVKRYEIASVGPLR